MNILTVLPSPIAAEIAYRLWGSLGTPEAVHERDRAVHDAAVTGSLEVNGKTVTTYTWGSGRRVILLVHGWRSRASRLSRIVGALQAPDATIVSFDAPGNGDSPGNRTTVLDYAEAIHQLGERHGRFEAIVAHSFGVLASFLAVREGTATRRIVGISGMHDAGALVDQFAHQLSLPARVVSGLRDRIERRTFTVVDDPWSRFVARIDDPGVPVLLVHDADDRLVRPAQLERIASDHPGAVEVLRTSGLGHSRILSDPAVLAAVTAFVTASARRTRSSASSPGTPSRS